MFTRVHTTLRSPPYNERAADSLSSVSSRHVKDTVVCVSGLHQLRRQDTLVLLRGQHVCGCDVTRDTGPALRSTSNILTETVVHHDLLIGATACSMALPLLPPVVTGAFCPSPKLELSWCCPPSSMEPRQYRRSGHHGARGTHVSLRFTGTSRSTRVGSLR